MGSAREQTHLCRFERILFVTAENVAAPLSYEARDAGGNLVVFKLVSNKHIMLGLGESTGGSLEKHSPTPRCLF
jgi:hypothetical protein